MNSAVGFHLDIDRSAYEQAPAEAFDLLRTLPLMTSSQMQKQQQHHDRVKSAYGTRPPFNCAAADVVVEAAAVPTLVGGGCLSCSVCEAERRRYHSNDFDAGRGRLEDPCGCAAVASSTASWLTVASGDVMAPHAYLSGSATAVDFRPATHVVQFPVQPAWRHLGTVSPVTNQVSCKTGSNKSESLVAAESAINVNSEMSSRHADPTLADITVSGSVEDQPARDHLRSVTWLRSRCCLCIGRRSRRRKVRFAVRAELTCGGSDVITADAVATDESAPCHGVAVGCKQCNQEAETGNTDIVPGDVDSRFRKYNGLRLSSRCMPVRALILFLTGLLVLCVSLLTVVLLAEPLQRSLIGYQGKREHLTSEADLRNGKQADSESDVVIVTVLPSNVKHLTTDQHGWAYFVGGSENGSRYAIVDSAMTFYAGQERCQQLDGHLVHINSLREQLFVEDFLSQTLTKLQADDSVGFWIGAKRSRGSHDGTCMYDQWKWIDFYGRAMGTISGMTAFAPGKPDNYYDPEECLYISTQEDSTDESRYMKWDDAPCDLNSIGGIKVICEVDLRSALTPTSTTTTSLLTQHHQLASEGPRPTFPVNGDR